MNPHVSRNRYDADYSARTLTAWHKRQGTIVSHILGLKKWYTQVETRRLGLNKYTPQKVSGVTE